MSLNKTISILTSDEMDTLYASQTIFAAGQKLALSLSNDELGSLLSEQAVREPTICYSVSDHTLSIQTEDAGLVVIALDDATAQKMAAVDVQGFRFVKD